MYSADIIYLKEHILYAGKMYYSGIDVCKVNSGHLHITHIIMICVISMTYMFLILNYVGIISTTITITKIYHAQHYSSFFLFQGITVNE